MKNVGVIINPYAKKVRTGKVSTDVFNDIGPEIVDLRITKSLNELDSVLTDFKRQDIPYIGVTGGDGSLHHVLSRMVPIYGPENIPPIVILKGGTMDNVSKTIGLKGKGHEILKRLVKRINSHEPVETYERDTMKLNGQYGFLFGIGLITNFLNEVYRGEKGIKANTRGIFKIMAHAIHEPSRGSLFEGIEAEITIDGEKLPFSRITGILAGTVEHISKGTAPLYRANKEDGTFHLITTGLSPKKFLIRVPLLLNGFSINHRHHFDGTVKNLIIHSENPFEYTIDGDIYRCEGDIKLEVGPRIKLVYV